MWESNIRLCRNVFSSEVQFYLTSMEQPLRELLNVLEKYSEKSVRLARKTQAVVMFRTKFLRAQMYGRTKKDIKTKERLKSWRKGDMWWRCSSGNTMTILPRRYRLPSTGEVRRQQPVPERALECLFLSFIESLTMHE